MRLIHSNAFPSGHRDVTVFSAAPCVSAARMVRARRDGADPLSHPAHLPRTQGVSFFVEAAVRLAWMDSLACTRHASLPAAQPLRGVQKETDTLELSHAQ
jgi:hypothetical protein